MTLPFAPDAARPQVSGIAADPSADVRGVMRLIEYRLDDILAAIPARSRPHFAEALLRVALHGLDTAGSPRLRRTLLARLA